MPGTTHLYNRLVVITVIILSLLSIRLSFAADLLSGSPRFNSLWVDQGLPNNSVTAITQDHQGYLWLGTFNGLSRFDGYRLKNFHATENQPHSLSNDDIKSLLLDSRGTLWVGTQNGGLNRYDAKRQNFHAFKHQHNNPRSLSSNTITALLDNGDGTLWVGTGKGLDLFDSSSGGSRRFEHDPQNPGSSLPPKAVRALLKTAGGQLWVGSNGGLAVYQSHSRQFRAIGLPGVTAPSIRALREDPLGQIWIAALQGLFRYDPQTGRITDLSHHTQAPHRMLSLVLADDGSIWAGSSHHGLYRFAGDDNVNPLRNHYRYDKSNASSLPDNTLMSLYIDHGGVLWAGTFNAGAASIPLNSLAFGLFNDSADSIGCLPGPAVSSIYPEQHDNILWLGTQAGLARVERQSGQCRAFTTAAGNANGLPSAEIKTIYRDKNQRLWVGTGKGLVSYNEATEQFEKADDHLPNSVITLVTEDQKARLVAGTNRGLYIKDPLSGHFIGANTRHDVLKLSKVHTHAVDPQGRLWIGTQHGLASLDGDTLSYPADNRRFTRPVRALYVDHNNTIWIGTEQAGLFKFSAKTDNWQGIKLPGDFPENAEFHGILADDDGNLWISSSHGLLRFNRQSGAIQVFHARNGLQSEVFFIRSAVKGATGELYFGGRKGFNRFHPGQIQINQTPPKVLLSGFSYFNQPMAAASGLRDNSADVILSSPIALLDELVLSHRDYVFGFEFAAMDFADPSGNRFAYQMQGFDPHWNDTNAVNRRATYTNLDPGSYTFRVKAANQDGIWNQQGVSLRVTVKPAPWASPLAYGVYLLLLLGSIYGIYRYRTASLRKRAALLQHSVDERTRELASEKQVVEALLSKKNDEFANVSHEFRTPLTLVLGPISQLLSSDINDHAKQKLTTMRRNAYRLLRMVDQLLDMEKFSVQRVSNKTAVALQPLLNLIAQSFKDVAEQKQLTFTIGTIDEVYLRFTPDAVEKIILNLISNAIKYTPAGGQIQVEAIALTDGRVRFTVQDSGIGIAPEQQQLVFERFQRVLDKRSERVTGAGIGLALVKELVEAHGGEISLQSEPQQGTRISVLLPVTARPDDAGGKNAVEANRDIIELELETLGEQLPAAAAGVADGSTSETSAGDDQPALLIIEDNPDMRAYILQSLQPQYHCSLAGNGREGVEKALQQVPDIIVSDVMMPEMDGYEVTRRIKSDARTSHIPVILLTARGDRQSRLKGWHEKADEYLTKPFDPQELRIRINSLLSIRDLLRQRFNQSVFDSPPQPQLQSQETAESTPEPGQAGVVTATAEALKLQAQSVFIDKLNGVIEQLYQSQQTTIGQIASAVAMSERQLFRKLKGTLEMNPTQYLRRFRLEKACELLRQGGKSSTVALEVGFSSHSYFSRCFSAQYGCAPSAFAHQG